MKSARGLAIVFALWGCSRGGPPGPPEATANVPMVSLGNVMVGIARRFELAGRAVKANRFELAEFEVGEIEESFEADVPNAELPKEGPTAHIPAMAKSFLLANAPELRRAAAAKDPAAFAAAFQHAAAVCNACHQAAAKGFIQVPFEPGEAVPDLRPASPTTPHP
jgi:mono/diheme cytochrome c family protein